MVQLAFRWIQNGFSRILTNIREGSLYLIDEDGTRSSGNASDISFETLDLLVFKALGGKNSQIYIYVNRPRP